jgi:hypothetical protein
VWCIRGHWQLLLPAAAASCIGYCQIHWLQHASVAACAGQSTHWQTLANCQVTGDPHICTACIHMSFLACSHHAAMYPVVHLNQILLRCTSKSSAASPRVWRHTVSAAEASQRAHSRGTREATQVTHSPKSGTCTNSIAVLFCCNGLRSTLHCPASLEEHFACDMFELI